MEVESARYVWCPWLSQAGEEKRPESLASANAATKTTATAPPQRPRDTKRELQVPNEPVDTDESDEDTNIMV